MQERTVIYAVHGRDMYFNEAARSARSLRAHDSSARIVAYLRPEDEARLDRAAFDEIRSRDVTVRPGLRIDFQLKLLALTEGISGPTLFLDSDTLVCAPLDPAWSLLGRFDVLACHAPWRRRLRYENYDMPDFVSDVPDAFCEFNTGVLFLADNRQTASLLQAWQELYDKAPGSGDQYLFMHVVFYSDCRLYVLPSEYNFRFRAPQFVGDRVRIVHGHGQEIEQALQTANQSLVPRISFFRDAELRVITVVPPKHMAPGTRKP